MKKTVIQIIIAYVFHAIIIGLDFLFMSRNPDGLIISVIVLDVAYLIYWIVTSVKEHMPWLVYLNFISGSIVEAALYWWGLTSGDHKPFDGGLEQVTLIIFLVLHALVLGVSNLVLWILDKGHKNQQTEKQGDNT